MNDGLQALFDRQEITEVLMRYTRGIDRVDRDLLLSVYHPDAIDNHGPFRGGPAEFVDWAMGLLDSFEVSQHSTSNAQIELHGDRANVESYLHILHVLKNPRREEIIFVRLLDKFERRNGHWKISDRLVVVDYSATRPSEAAYSDAGHYVSFGRDRSDPVYSHRWPAQGTA